MQILIYKYPLAYQPGLDQINVPQGSKVLHIADQNGTPYLWLAFDPKHKDTSLPMMVATVWTGLAVTLPDDYFHAGSVETKGLVCHYYVSEYFR